MNGPERGRHGAPNVALEAVVALVVGVVVAVSGCTAGPSAGPPATTVPTPVATPPLSAGPPQESELSPGWDEQPDGPSATPDAALSGMALSALLRTRSSSPGGKATCRPADVSAVLQGFDAATGHRYTFLVVTNTSSRPCVVDGVPGIGARGEWGNRFTLTVETAPLAGARPVRLAPGAQAQSVLEWTGELAGHDAERASLLVVQLAPGQTPIRVPARLTGLSDTTADTLDLGILSTIRLTAFERRD